MTYYIAWKIFKLENYMGLIIVRILLFTLFPSHYKFSGISLTDKWTYFSQKKSKESNIDTETQAENLSELIFFFLNATKDINH